MAEPLSSFSGVSSGVDWKALVDQIITIDKRPATAAQAAIDANTKRKDALGQFRAALTTLRTAAEALTSAAPFETYTASAAGADATGRSVLAAVAGGAGAAGGSYDVRVTALAAAQKTTAGAGLAPAAGVGADGTLTLARPNGGAELARVAVTAADTLATVRDKINAANAGPSPSGVQATLVSVSATEQRLVLSSTAAGADGAFVVGDDGASGLLGRVGLDPADADPARRPGGVPASNAQLTVDGIPVTRSTNSVADAVPGVTLTLSALGASTVTVARQAGATSDAVKAFVDGYNALQKFIAKEGAPKGTLAGEPMLRTVRGSLPGVVLAALPEGVGAPDRNTLASVGVSLQRDGTLAFDAAKFAAAADGGRLGDVRALFGDRLRAVADLASGYVNPGVGAVDARADALEMQNVRLQGRIDDITSRLDKKRAALLAQYAKFEASLGRMKAIGDSLSAQFSGLNKSSDG